MQLDYIDYFLHLCQTGSFSRASDELFMTRQNLSRIINDMEKELNITIFERHAKGVSLTHQGEIFFQFAQQTQNAYKEMQEQLADYENKQNINETLNIFGGVFILAILVPGLVRNFLKRYPGIRVLLHEGDPFIAMEEVKSSATNIGVIPILEEEKFSFIYRPALDDMRLRPIYQDSFKCIVSKSHPFARREKISLDEFMKEPYVDAMKNHILIKAMGSEMDFSPVFSSNNIQLYLEALQKSNGVGFICDKFYQLNKDTPDFKNLCVVDFVENFNFTAHLVMKKGEKNQAAELFADFISK